MTQRDGKQSGRDLAAWASFAAFLAAAYFGGAAVLLRALAYFGWLSGRPVSSGREVLAILGLGLLYIVISTYVAGICWLAFARLVFSHREARMVVCHGPTTAFDRWLLNTIVPEDPETGAAAVPSNNRWRGP